MRVLIFGGAGMLGHKLCQHCRARFETWTTVRSTAAALTPYDPCDAGRILPGVDAMRIATVAEAVDRVKPSAVINCIGVTSPFCDARNPLPALAINAIFPHQLADICRQSRTRLIHISTDGVFSGRKGMYREEDAPCADNLYGRTKFLGEVGGRGCLTLRTSILGRELIAAHGLVEWFLANRNGKVRGFRRAVYTGFTTQALAGIIADILEKHPDLEGLYHVSSDPINKFDLLGLINEIHQLEIQIEPDADFICDRSLDSTKFRGETGFRPQGWREMIQDMRQDPTPYDAWRAGNEQPCLSTFARRMSRDRMDRPAWSLPRQRSIATKTE
ncbi:MAG TPA: SDR family oxidoreductase [Thermoguttaceae bacterium]|nr:SDR family oxidoreductase [Thermoguttaceae bacterium]